MTAESKPRVLMADDHSILLAGVRKLIEDQCEVVGAVENGRALVEAAERMQPELILLDISMPLLNGIDAARQMCFCFVGVTLASGSRKELVRRVFTSTKAIVSPLCAMISISNLPSFALRSRMR